MLPTLRFYAAHSVPPSLPRLPLVPIRCRIRVPDDRESVTTVGDEADPGDAETAEPVDVGAGPAIPSSTARSDE